jgi:hypothetical protein
MKRIIDENIERCDIYVRDNSPSLVKQQIEEFHRFVECHLNRIRRLKKPRVRMPLVSLSLTLSLDIMGEA